jgi:transcriptional regulator with XRE-family HTH domain
MKKAKDLHAQWAKDPEYRSEYDSLEAEFDLARALISARSSAGLSQQQVADRMETSQSFVARLEGGVVTPTWTSLRRYAKATGSRLKVELIPVLEVNPKSKPLTKPT